MTPVERLASELFIGNAVATLVVATGKGAPRGPASERIAQIVDMLIQTAATRQTYSFMRVLSGIPEAVSAMGWILDRAEQRATKFLEGMSPPVALNSVVSATAQAGDTGVLLLQCIGQGRLVESPPLPPRKAEAVLGAIRMCIFPRNALPDLFSDAVTDGREEPAWAVHGVGSIGAYMDTRLREDDDAGTVAVERRQFIRACKAEVRRLLTGYEKALDAGTTVRIPVWAVGHLSCTKGASVVALGPDDAQTSLASGVCWLLSQSQFPAKAQFIKVTPTAGTGPCGVSLRLEA